MVNIKTISTLLTLLLLISFENANSLSLRARMKPSVVTSEIAGSLLELIASPSEAFVHNDEREDIINERREISKLINNSWLNIPKYSLLLSTQNNSSDLIIHSPYQSPGTPKMRLWAFVSLFVFGTIFLLIRSSYNLIKNINTFFGKGIATLSNQILFLFIFFSIFFISFIYGSFDNIYVNWEYLLASIAYFILGWILFCSIILLLSLTITKKWKNLETLAQSFTFLKDKIKENPKNSELIEAFELLVLKRYFFVPLFPMLKASSLRKEMKISIYLEYCLSGRLRHFFKISWTSWVCLVMVTMIWNVFIAHSGILVETIFIMLVPLLGIIIMLIVYGYLKCVYRKIVTEINSESIHEFKDTEYFSNDLFQSLVYPVYLKKAIDQENQIEQKSKVKASNFTHEHFHQRQPSLYEDEFLFGQTTFPLIMNTLQCCCIVFICWIILTLSHYTIVIANAYSNYAYFFIIPITICYIITQSYVLVIALKWFTMITSIEMKRNEKCVKKLIKYHVKKAGKLSESIFIQFKKLYFDNKAHLINNEDQLIGGDDQDSNNSLDQRKEFELTYPTLINLLKTNYLRFKKSVDESINIADELQPFLKSCGNELTNEEIEFTYHIIDNLPQMNGKINLKNLNDICGAMIYFRTLKPYDIVFNVFDYYYKRNENLFEKETQGLKWKNIELFLESHQLYFNKEMTAFIKDECSYMGDQFSLDAFISTILTPRQFYAY